MLKIDTCGNVLADLFSIYFVTANIFK